MARYLGRAGARVVIRDFTVLPSLEFEPVKQPVTAQVDARFEMVLPEPTVQ